MPRSTPRRAALALACTLALLGAGCGDDDEAASQPTEETAPAPGDDSTTSTSSSATTATSEGEAPESGNVVEVTVADGQPVGGPRDVEVPAGEEVTLRITSDAPDELHVHGYDLTAQLAPGEPAELTFTADIPGQWEVELHEAEALLVTLVVS